MIVSNQERNRLRRSLKAVLDVYFASKQARNEFVAKIVRDVASGRAERGFCQAVVNLDDKE